MLKPTLRMVLFGAGAGLLITLNIVAAGISSDSPLWLHVLGWYVGVAVWFSLFVPMRTGRTIDTLKNVGPVTKVLGGLLWPLIVVVWAAARLAAMLQ